MAYKKIPQNVKVSALKEALELKNISKIAKKYEISEDTIRNDFNKLIKSIDETIKRKKPGPKNDRKDRKDKKDRKNNAILINKLIPKKEKKP